MPRMSWPSWRRTRTVTRAAGMATGAGGARHCWSRGAVSRRREARTGQPGAEQQGRLGARRRAATARDSRGADPRGTAGARVLRAGAPGRRDRSCAGAPVGRHQGATDGAALQRRGAARTSGQRATVGAAQENGAAASWRLGRGARRWRGRVARRRPAARGGSPARGTTRP